MWLMHSLRMYFTSWRPSAVRPDMPMPMWESMGKSFFWWEERSLAARFKLASTTPRLLWDERVAQRTARVRERKEESGNGTGSLWHAR